MARLSSEKGSTLVGELVAVAILGMALTVILGAISTSMMGVAIVERRVAAESVARSQLEVVKAADYQVNPTAVPYPVVAPASGYSVGLTVTYWVSPSGPFTTALQTPDGGLQGITVTVRHRGEPVVSLEGLKVER